MVCILVSKKGLDILIFYVNQLFLLTWILSLDAIHRRGVLFVGLSAATRIVRDLTA